MSPGGDGGVQEEPTLRLIEDPDDVGWYLVACVGELSDEAAAMWARALADEAFA